MNRLAASFAAAALFVAPASAWAAHWTVDPAKSTLGFSGTQTGTPFSGHFTKFDANIDFDPAHPEAGHASVVIDMASAVTGDTQRDESLPQADWFDVKDFPKADFEATGFRSKGDNDYEAVGTLTIRGLKKDVVLPFTLDVNGDIAAAKGKLTLVRSDYGIGQGAWATGQWVALEVDVNVDLTAKKAP